MTDPNATKQHTHTDKCWEPDSGCDMGRNEKYVRSSNLVTFGNEKFNVNAILRHIDTEAEHAYGGSERTQIQLVARLIRAQQTEIDRLTRTASHVDTLTATVEARDGEIGQLRRENLFLTRTSAAEASNYRQLQHERDALVEYLARLRVLLALSDAAMRNFFSNEFDGGAQFSELTADIPKAQEGLPDETSADLLALARDISTMDCFYSGSGCAPSCQCIVARACRAIHNEPSVKTKAALDEMVAASEAIGGYDMPEKTAEDCGRPVRPHRSGGGSLPPGWCHNCVQRVEACVCVAAGERGKVIYDK